MEIKNLKKAAKRILSAIKSKERIILFGDADLDGTTSVIILEEAIKSFNGQTFPYFPERGIEGYGLSQSALKSLKKYAPALIIMLDCGIGNFKEIVLAREMGFEVIIIDHHEILQNVPPSSVVINPKQKGDKYPFKSLAACGLTFKLAQLLLDIPRPHRRGRGMSNLKQSFLELVSLGTIADMMPQTGDNQILIENGLSSLNSTFRPGLRAILNFFDSQNLSPRELAPKIISLLQITDLEDHLTESYLVLSASDETEVKKLLEILKQKNSQRRELIKGLTEEITEEVAVSPSVIVFKGGEEVPWNLPGAIASRICNKFKKPTFIFNSNQELSRGSIRTPSGVNSIEALKHCQSLLEVYGGHPPASGFTVKNENLEKLRECLIEYFKKI